MEMFSSAVYPPADGIAPSDSKQELENSTHAHPQSTKTSSSLTTAHAERQPRGKRYLPSLSILMTYHWAPYCTGSREEIFSISIPSYVAFWRKLVRQNAFSPERYRTGIHELPARDSARSP